MISEPLYKILLCKKIEEHKRKHDVAYDAYKLPEASSDITTLLRNRTTLRNNVDTLNSLKPQSINFDAVAAIRDYFTPLFEEYTISKNIILQEEQEALGRLKQQHDVDILLAKKKAKETISPLVDKHEQLRCYRDSLKDVMSRYNIKPSDIKIADDISMEEFEVLLDASLKICETMSLKKKNKLALLYWPLEQEDRRAAVYYLVFLFLLFYFAAPFICIGFIGYMYYSVIGMYKKLDKLRIAESLMYNINFDKYIPTAPVEDIDPIDPTPILDTTREKLDNLEKNNPHVLQEKEEREAIAALAEIKAACDNEYKYASDKHIQVSRVHQKALTETEEAIKAYLDNVKEFGTYIHDSSVMSHKYTLARMSSTIDIIREIPSTNFIFDSSKRDVMLQFMKLMFCNKLLSVKEKHLYVTIYDPDNQGADFSEFYSSRTEEYVRIETKDIDRIVEEHRTYTQENIKILGKENIDDFNRKAEEVGKVTRDYKLLIILSDTKHVKEIAGFQKYMEYSAQYGVAIWMLDNAQIPGATYFKDKYNGDGDAIEYDPTLGAKVMSTYEHAIENSKTDGINYFTAFQPKYIPREKWWTYNTIKGVDLNFGLADGDPSKGYPMVLGDANVHCLIAGMTGAGKSALINQLLMSLTTKYSPRELQLCMVDFKNVEFASFTRNGKSILPHAQILAGTKDGEYAISVFDYLIAEMDRRTKIFADAGVKKLEEYRLKFPDAIMPRIVLLIDEFQVMFTEVEQRMVDVIKARIVSLSKLARFCGVHMIFCSQSMKGTLDKDILNQFSLRVALRCAADTSMDIIGSNIASKIKVKFGYCYTNDSGGENPAASILWRVPFAPTDKLMATIEELNQMCIDLEEVNRMADFYDQKTLYTKEDLDNWYDLHGMQLRHPLLMVLGERTAYSTNKAPEHFKFTNDDGENLAAVAFERKDLLNLTLTFIDNIKQKDEDATLLMHSADRDTHTLLDIPNILEPDLVELSDPNQDIPELVDALEEMVTYRQSRTDNKPLYFLAIQWEKVKGISREDSGRLQDKFKKVLQEAPLVGVHFIFICKEQGALPSFIYNACNHRIAAKVGDKDSYKFIDSGRAFKLPDANDGVFAIYKYGSQDSKFKIYQHAFTRELESRTIEIA